MNDVLAAGGRVAPPLIAIVDDNASVRRAVRRLFRALRMNADSFSSGEELLRRLATEPAYHPDCVILDVQMPGLNGLEVQRRLAGSALPIIFITGHEDTGVREQALAAGAVAFLRKPFGDELLIETVRAALAANPVQRVSARS